MTYSTINSHPMIPLLGLDKIGRLQISFCNNPGHCFWHIHYLPHLSLTPLWGCITIPLHFKFPWKIQIPLIKLSIQPGSGGQGGVNIHGAKRLRNQRSTLVVPPDVSTSVKEIWIGNVLLLETFLVKFLPAPEPFRHKDAFTINKF